MDIDELPYVAARLQQTLPAGTDIKWIVIHDMEAPEGPLTAENVARYFQSAEAKGSAHICADNNSCVKCVPYSKGAAHAPGANTNGKGIELAGYARQTRAEWLDPYSLDVLDNSADCCAQLLHKFNLPNQYVDAAGLRAGHKGWTTHWQVTLAFGRSTHTDPGRYFPLDYFQTKINHYYYDGGDFDLSDEQFNTIMESLEGLHVGVLTAVAKAEQALAMVAPNLNPETNLGGDTPWWNTHYTMSEVVHIRDQVDKMVEALSEVPSGAPDGMQRLSLVTTARDTMSEEMPELPKGLKDAGLTADA